MANSPESSLQALLQRGAAEFQAGRTQDATATFRQAADSSNDPGAFSNLAMVLASTGRLLEAIEASLKAVRLRPEVPELHSNLGNALQLAGQLDEAIGAYRQALKLRPDNPDAQTNLAHALTTRGSFDEAIALLKPILSAHPNAYASMINMAIALQGIGDLDAAIAINRKVLAGRPDSAGAHANLALALRDAGRLDPAIHHLRRSLDLQLDPRIADALLVLLQYHPDTTQEMILAEHRDWYATYIQNQITPATSHPNDPSPTRRLRIGYESPDFRAHPVGYNVLPLLERHNRDQFEIFCYSNTTCPDAITDRFQKCAHRWRDTRALSNEQTASQIRADQIDILVDLALHTGQNRLAVFAAKPAPIQVTFAGYPGTSGLPTIDYRLTDPYLDPIEVSDRHYCEKPVRLPNTFWCYQPLGTEPEVSPLPALANGFVTFGCLNNFCKVNDPALKSWARVLAGVPNSRLILLARQGAHRDRTKNFFDPLDIDPARIEFQSPSSRDAYLRMYHRVDVALDTFPYNGHTTSLDAFWMGVPVVTLIGSAPVGRAGWSQLQNLGLTHLAGENTDQFVRIAVNLAADLPALETLRSTLRLTMTASALTDAAAFASNIESAFRTLWRKWCHDRQAP